jgi:uncharacterized protein
VVDGVIPLFPLHTVLFPDGPLTLRIFETRYTDMVRDCMRQQQPFGVVLIEQGEEAGDVALTATVGCTARIADFYTLKDGLLGISCVGGRRFRVSRVWREPDGLNRAEVTWLPAEPATTLPPEYAEIGATVRNAVEELAERYQHVDKRYDEASWTSARLTELLPIALPDKQALLELDDPLLRLDALVRAMQQHGTQAS